jgi:mannose-6-phosphate isomerase-like protein (cupin superfamily)
MKVFNIRDLYQEKYKEYVVGSHEIQKHSVYLVYGEVSRGEQRKMSPSGHDEILFLMSGEGVLENNDGKTPLSKEQAVYMNPEEVFTFIAKTDCRYVIAGTHITPHEH